MKILLLIDMQLGFEVANEIIPYIEKLNLENYDCIIATEFINNESTLFYKNGYTKMMEDDFDTHLYPVVGDIANYIIKKDTYSIPLDKLYDIVKKDDIESIDIVGVETDACVLATMFALWDEKIPFRLLKSRSAGLYGIHEAAKLVMRRNFFFEPESETKVFHRIKDYFK